MNMAPTKRLVASFEGLCLTPYLDMAGIPTIGYGHVLRTGEAFPEPFTEETAENYLTLDLEAAYRAVVRLIISPLNENQATALISWTFNLGSARLKASTLRRVINRGDYTSAPAEIRRWVFAGGQKVRGLVIRREIEARLFAA